MVVIPFSIHRRSYNTSMANLHFCSSDWWQLKPFVNVIDAIHPIISIYVRFSVIWLYIFSVFTVYYSSLLFVSQRVKTYRTEIIIKRNWRWGNERTNEPLNKYLSVCAWVCLEVKNANTKYRRISNIKLVFACLIIPSKRECAYASILQIMKK